ncbi:MAG TPA: hypothetical protein VM434_18545 [Beijerinckiaceae bacterium]|nr:hypothetical protein [Beijerinckiaceae bacterium]
MPPKFDLSVNELFRSPDASPAKKPPVKAVTSDDVLGCDECGDKRGPWWGDLTGSYCRRHADPALKNPTVRGGQGAGIQAA